MAGRPKEKNLTLADYNARYVAAESKAREAALARQMLANDIENQINDLRELSVNVESIELGALEALDADS